jgi:hypothetical protein
MVWSCAGLFIGWAVHEALGFAWVGLGKNMGWECDRLGDLPWVEMG